MKTRTGWVFVNALTGEPGGRTLQVFNKMPTQYIRNSRARIGLKVVEVTVTELDRSLLDGSRKF